MNTPHEPSPTSKDKMDGTPSSPSRKATGGWRYSEMKYVIVIPITGELAVTLVIDPGAGLKSGRRKSP